MRIGQILLEAELITPKQLSDGLLYGKAKNIFIGRAVRLLKFVEEDNIDRALQAQKLINMGLSPVRAVEALKRAVKEGTAIDKALQDELVPSVAAEPHAPVVANKDNSPEVLIKEGDALLLEDCCVEAEEHYKLALANMEGSLGVEHIDLAPVLVRLGNAFLATHDFDKAKECYDRVLGIRTKSLPENHPQIAQTHESLADLYNARGEDAQAVESFLTALDILETNLPGQLGAYASILKKVTSAQTHKPEQGKTLPIGEILKAAGLLPPRDLETALRMSKQQSLPLGIVLRENCMVGDRELQSALKAQFCVRQGVLTEQLAIDLLTRAARRDISLERLLHEAGVLVTDSERFDVYRQIASDLDKLVAAESSAVKTQQDLAPIAYRLGTLYEQIGDQPQAEVYYQRALTIWGAAGDKDLTAAKTCISLAKIFQSQRRMEEVVPLLLKALEHRQHVLGNSHDETIETLEDLSEAQLDYGLYKEALDHAQKAISYREELGQEGTNLLRSVILQGDSMVKLKDYEGAQLAYKRAMVIAQPPGSKPTAALAAVMERQGDLYDNQKLSKVAVPLYKSALMILEAAGKKDSKASENLKKKISKLDEAG